MFIVLVLSSAFAFPYGPAHDEVLVADLRPASVEEVAPEPVWLVEPSELLHGDSVIDLHEAPPLQPAPTVHMSEATTRTAEACAAVTVEALTRE